MRHLKTILAVLGAATVLVLAGNTISLAATGNALILGKGNSANKQTTVTRTTTGPVLRLNAKQAANAPFTTNARGKVTNLNADKVDGLDSTTLRTRTYRFSAVVKDMSRARITLPIANGSYLVSYSSLMPVQDAGSVGCVIVEDPAGPARPRPVALTSATYPGTGYFPALSGTGLVSKTAGGSVHVECSADSDWDNTDVPLQIDVTPTQRVSTQTLTAVEPDDVVIVERRLR